jgi:hypothetical protein
MALLMGFEVPKKPFGVISLFRRTWPEGWVQGHGLISAIVHIVKGGARWIDAPLVKGARKEA